MQRSADIKVVLKFDRLSRSIKHFGELYERYFKSGEKELIAIRRGPPLFLATAHACGRCSVAFEPGAPQCMALTPAGQTLIITAGTRWVQEWHGKK